MFNKKSKEAKAPKIIGPKKCGVLISQRSITVFSEGLDAALNGAAKAKEYPVEEGKIAAALRVLLDRGEIGRDVAIGLDPTLDFLSTARSDDPAQIQAQSQLSERLSSRLPGGVVSRENKAGKGKVKLKSQVLFPRRIGVGVLEGLVRLGRSRVAMVSTTHALYEFCKKKKASPRKWKTEIRLIIGEPESIALLVFNGVVVVRQTLPTAGDGKVAALKSIVQRLVVAARKELQLGDVYGVVLHTSEVDMPILQQSCEGLGAPCLQGAPIPISRGVLAAIVCHSKRKGRGAPLDLNTELQLEGERPAFPLKPALVPISVLLGIGGWMWFEGSVLWNEISQMDSQIEALQIEREITRDDILDVRDAMGIEVGLVEAFIGQRVYWGEVGQSIPALIPAGMKLYRLEGKYEFFFVPKVTGATEGKDEEGGSEKSSGPPPNSRTLGLVCKVPMVGKKIPPQNRQLTAALRASEVISKPFPSIDEPKITSTRNGESSEVEVTVNCRPPGGI
ncbi:MAG: hypothetical protein HQ519_11260 [Planctomycetes bacterium]|nr:hypothetical protein [Planctomycetota bacterium]